MDISILKIREFINKESVYMLMLSFILLFNAYIIFSEKIPGLQEDSPLKRTTESYLASKEEKVESGQLVDKGMSWRDVLKFENKNRDLALSILGFFFISVLSLGLFLDIRILMAKVKKREILPASAQHLRVGWGIWDIFRLVIIFVFLGYILHIIEVHFLPSPSEKKGMLTFIPLLNTGIMDLVLLGFIIYFVKVKYSQSLEAIGLKIKDVAKNIYLAILGYIATLPILVSLLLLSVWLASSFNYEPLPQPILKFFLQEKRVGLLIFSTMMVVILGPIIEEIFFRGFTYNAIKRRWGTSMAMALTAIAFSGLHANIIGFLPIMSLGLLLAYMYEKTGSLIASITIHILHNFLMVVFLFSGKYFISPAL